MKQAIDKDGRILQGHFRTDTGALVVRNEALLEKMRAEKERTSKVEKLEEEVKNIKTMLQQVINMLNKE